MAGVATVVVFSTVAALALSGPSSRTSGAHQQPHRLAIAERFAPAPRAQIIAQAKPAPVVPSAFAGEQQMSLAELMKRWDPTIKNASKRFKVPAAWIREVIRLESGGRTMLGENTPMTSSRGALGLMQLLPETYAEMSAQYGLGKDPFNPHDNIFAGAAYLKWLRGKYGYPAMFAAYNDGPGNYEARTAKGTTLPEETRNYVTAATLVLGGGASARNPLATQATAAPAAIIPAALTIAPPTSAFVAPPATNTAQIATATSAKQASGASVASSASSASAPVATGSNPAPSAVATGSREVTLGAWCFFTRADGSHFAVNCAEVSGVRAPLQNEYRPEVQAVMTVGRGLETARESVDAVRQIVLAHGGHV